MRFANPSLLWPLLGVVPLTLLLIFGIVRKRKAYKKLNAVGLKAKWLKSSAVFLILSYLLLSLAMARPQIGVKKGMVSHEGLNIILAIDVSASMLAEDLPPNRIAQAKSAINFLLDRLTGDRVGLIPFAEHNFLQWPMTVDYSALKMFLDAIDRDTMSSGGTNFKGMIETAIEAFGEDESSHKVLIIFSDGEDQGTISNKVIKSATNFALNIYSVGIGSEAGEPIPIRSENGEIPKYKRTKNGKIVITKLNEKLLRKLSDSTNGNYYRLTELDEARQTRDRKTREMEKLLNDLSSLKKTEISLLRPTKYAELFQYFLGLALLFLGIEYLIDLSRKC